MQIKSTCQNRSAAMLPASTGPATSEAPFRPAPSSDLVEIGSSAQALDGFYGVGEGLIRSFVGITIWAAGGTLAATLRCAAMGFSGWGLVRAGLVGFLLGGVIGEYALS
jgi:hypothetical protein